MISTDHSKIAPTILVIASIATHLRRALAPADTAQDAHVQRIGSDTGNGECMDLYHVECEDCDRVVPDLSWHRELESTQVGGKHTQKYDHFAKPDRRG